MKQCEKCGRELYDDEICDCEKIAISKSIQNHEPTGKWKVILTAILYPALAMGISAYVMNSSLGLGIAVIMNITGALCIYYGGFTLLVIPLPFIYLYRVGCINRHIKLWIRIVLGILAFLLIFGSVVIAASV